MLAHRMNQSLDITRFLHLPLNLFSQPRYHRTNKSLSEPYSEPFILKSR